MNRSKFSLSLLFLLLAIAGGNAMAEPKRELGGFGFFGRRANPPAERENARGEEKRRDLAARSFRERRLGRQNEQDEELVPKRKYLTPEERRALRRQIQEAGNDIYLPEKN